MKDEPRTLETLCDKEDFHIELLGNVYCKLGFKRDIECKYYSFAKDHNGIKPCLNPKYTKDYKRYN